MNEAITTDTNITETIILAIISSGIINVIITHILYNIKLKKEQKSRGNDMIANEIATSLQSFRDIELRLTTNEIYDIKNEIQNRQSKISLFGRECIYPEILNDWESLKEFQKSIAVCRKKHEKNFSCKIALNLVFIEKYLLQLSLFMSEHRKFGLPEWGTIFIFDLHKWQSKIDKLLVKEINKHNYKLESHRTIKWHWLRKRELTKQYENTLLYFLINNKCSRRKRKLLQIFRQKLEDAGIMENKNCPD